MARAESFYVYALLDPRKRGCFEYNSTGILEFEPFYIGKGQGRRASQHLTEARSSERSTFKINKIRKIESEGLSVVIVKIEENLSESAALLLEKTVIQEIGRHNVEGGPLTNVLEGGVGQMKISPELLSSRGARIRESVAKRSEEDRARIAENARNKALAQWESVSDARREELSEILIKAHRVRMPDEKQAERDRKSDSHKKRYGLMTDDERSFATRARVDAAKAQYVQCPHCPACAYLGRLKSKHFSNCKFIGSQEPFPHRFNEPDAWQSRVVDGGWYVGGGGWKVKEGAF